MAHVGGRFSPARHFLPLIERVIHVRHSLTYVACESRLRREARLLPPVRAGATLRSGGASRKEYPPARQRGIAV